LAGRYGGRWSLGAQYGSIRHAITFRSFEVSVRGAALSEGLDLAEGREAAWLKEDEISEKPHSSLVRKVFDKLGGNRDQGGA
jgi:hypothetical protein